MSEEQEIKLTQAEEELLAEYTQSKQETKPTSAEKQTGGEPQAEKSKKEEVYEEGEDDISNVLEEDLDKYGL